jgi:hypothetical protein
MASEFEDRKEPRGGEEEVAASPEVKVTPDAGRAAFWKLLGFDGPPPEWLDKGLFDGPPQRLLDENTAPPIDEEARNLIRRCVRLVASADEQDRLRLLAHSYLSWRNALAAAYRDEDERATGENAGGPQA